jgi:hypothetical protein
VGDTQSADGLRIGQMLMCCRQGFRGFWRQRSTPSLRISAISMVRSR